MDDVLVGAVWRKSSFSGNGGAGGGNCVELAALADGTVGLRRSRRPEDGALRFTRAEIAAWVAGCKAGEFDDLG